MTDNKTNSEQETKPENDEGGREAFGPQMQAEQGKKSRFTITDRRFWARKKKEDDTPDEGETDEPALRKPKYVEELEQKVKENEEQLRKYIAAYKENQKESSAFRERLNKTAETRIETTLADFFRNYLEVLDNFERSIKYSEETNDFNSLLTGIKMVHQQTLALLKTQGVEAQERLGLEFDPHFDEVVEIVKEAGPDRQPGAIVDELQKCYLFKGNLLRPSKVRIFQPSTAENSEQSETSPPE